MKTQRHAGAAALERISPLLDDLRAYPMLVEKRPGVFYLGMREFMHFHELSGDVVADVRLTRAFTRMPVTTRAGQLDLLDRIADCLTVSEEKEDRQRLKNRRGNRRAARGQTHD